MLRLLLPGMIAAAAYGCAPPYAGAAEQARPSDLLLRARVGLEHEQEATPRVAAILIAHNPGSGPAAVSFPPYCRIFLRAYRSAEHTGPAAWDQERLWRDRAGGCKLPARPDVVPAGESREVAGEWVRTSEVLGDSLPQGRYSFEVVAAVPGGDSLLVLPAGERVLAP